ncbi:hypothetical protein CR162_21085 [Pseudoroseomonas rhizosphaerae]|uniref:Polyketide cyclase n=1 Tax=Teichococcus rhizosphaerae TaxID=1335062 RepID=A0A2C7A4S6_9PROT|nr:SRPBCC family protein [Pseudoroseomonas rhizosphaerae]PHK92969.1 hypothetical protein CR162_21085 [Pseudoroseomonas rhizosphaerae]
MQQSITISRPAAEVLAYVADLDHWREWLPQLRREETDRPEGDLALDRAAGTVRWEFSPSGEWRVEGEGKVARLTLRLDAETATPNDPTERQTPHDALASGMEAALQSLKSHLERAEGGDPVLHTAGAPQRAYGQSTGEDTDQVSGSP